MSRADPLEDPDLKALVSAAMQIRDQGLEPPLEELCCERPDLIESVRRSVETSSRLPGLQRLAATTDGLEGRVLAERYRLDERLGAGAMGVVFKAMDLELGRAVAVKVLRAVLLDGDEAEFRFVREAEVLAAIEHRAVVTVHDRGTTADDDPFLVMELLEGQPLSRILEDGKRDGICLREQGTAWIARALGVDGLEERSYLRTAASWTADLANGLAEAHRVGVFHRDVKPSNVFVRTDGRPVLLDFGIATRVDQATISGDSTPLGTPAYMAPESLQTEHQPGPALDVYGLTATLYHMLTLLPPFSGTPSQILTAVATQDPPTVQSLRPDLPRDLRAIIDRGMARRPEDRYACVEDLEADLRAFLDYQPVQARPLSRWTRTWRKLQRSPVFKTTVALLLVGGALLAGFQWRAEHQRNRQEALLEVWSHIPPSLGIVKPANRAVGRAEDRRALGDLLDRAVALSDQPLPARYLRATFLYDNNDRESAAREMQVIAQELGTDYSHELALRYRQHANQSQRGPKSGPVDKLESSDLPEPKTPDDLYLAGMEAIRAERIGEAMGIFSDPRLDRFLPAQEVATLLMARDPVAMYDKAAWIENQLGRRTAMTAHLLGLSLLLQKQYQRALNLIKEGLALAPRSPGLHVNAGQAAMRLGQLSLAIEENRTCIQLKPQDSLAYKNLVRVYLLAGDLEQAARVLDTFPGKEEGANQRSYLELLGEIESERALFAWQAGRTSEAAEVAEQALECFDRAMALGSKGTSARKAIAEALAHGEPEDVFVGLLGLLRTEPTHTASIRVLLGWMPSELDQEGTQALGTYLESLAESLDQRAGDMLQSDAVPPP